MATKLKLKREAAGSYRTEDGRFEIIKNPTVAANMWGALSTPWELFDRGKDAGDFGTLKEAKKEIERRLRKP
jgi:hypothetical protein